MGDTGPGAGDLVRALLVHLGEEEVAAARLPLDDDERRSWSYLPGERVGLALHVLPREAQQYVLRVVAAAVRPHTFAQVTAIMALEDVLDVSEGGSGRRHRGDYWFTVFGVPGDERWGWRFEGHHVSVNVSVVAGKVRAVPLFLGANPAMVAHDGAAVTRPLAREEDVARELLAALDPASLGIAVVDSLAPDDIVTRMRPSIEEPTPAGLSFAAMAAPARQLLQRLAGLYLERLTAAGTAQTRARLDAGGWEQVHFQWRGSTERGAPHYYAVTGPRLLVEYDNTANGANHVHTVLRDPQGDFGADLLAEHYARHH
jgi:hypothetical protein